MDKKNNEMQTRFICVPFECLEKNQLCTLIEYEGEKQKKNFSDSKMEFHHPRDGQVFWSQQQQQQRQKNAIAMI